ncbi:MAG: dienelactone hydrolase family protein [Gammaproteobacteria bacterium]|nr:dienelactone hydrolase family protein [Gammaproteobacteria bacterium]MCP4091725.1 dienelactone hydrolase family protein [Gammaproteobacteria bacterium]MCP4275032.1 dienelactone hydrolase family protein [Gammaproteobacteria bacterium]MCP4831855.1 dienelactone hydrolase family protein [Gammaproteobacteria bacterium]MCP4929791.1 dienelactone hydrolase family protein [Gammaproteobacteria bacterium]
MTIETISLTANDGHQLQACVGRPEGANKNTPKGGIVVIQEIFGLTGHIRSMVETFAAEGYLAIAPAMFDRVKPDVVLDYSDFDTALETMAKLEREQSLSDIQAAVDYVRPAGKVGIIGFCWGGSMADLSACHGLADAGISYYGRMTVEWLDLQPACPMLYHYGDRDALIPAETVEKIQRKRNGKVYTWGSADHGFLCEERPQYHKASAKQSMEITLGFLQENMQR